jgi:hypothetical protein
MYIPNAVRSMICINILPNCSFFVLQEFFGNGISANDTGGNVIFSPSMTKILSYLENFCGERSIAAIANVDGGSDTEELVAA